MGTRTDPEAALRDALAALAFRLPEIGDHLAADAAGPDMAAAASPDDTTVEAWLAEEHAVEPGLDRKAQAAFVIGRCAETVSLILSGLLLAGGIVPRLTAEAVRLSPERYRWHHEGESGETIRFRMHISCARLVLVRGGAGASEDAVHGALIDTLAPIVGRLRAVSGLAPGALWRLVADMVCSAFLRVGAALDVSDDARAFALSITGRAGSPLRNGRSGFQHVTLPDPSDPSRSLAERWFITRGGCCRWYTCPGSEPCSVCVLRKPEDQQDRLRAYLRRVHAASHA